MHIVILGNGISGVTCARHLRKWSQHDITLLSDESDEFFSRTALMYVFMGHLRERDTRPYPPDFWSENRIGRIRARIQRIDFQEKKLLTEDQRSFSYDVLVLATGSLPKHFDWPGQYLGGVQSLYHLQDLDAMERHTEHLLRLPPSAAARRAVVVGGGLIGVEMAEMLHARCIPLTFLVREQEIYSNTLPIQEAAMVSRHLREHGIDLRLKEELSEVLPDPSGQHCAAVVTKRGNTIPCSFVGLTVGVNPNIGFLQGTELATRKGVLTDEYLRTNLPDVYAIGDCAELLRPAAHRQPIEAVWYTGRMMGEAVAHNILADQAGGTPARQPIPYRPGIWFNSAKFFDLEHQVYGDIKTHLPDHQGTLYWEHPDGKKSIRINYERTLGAVVGFNLMGVRYRHEVCERWILDGVHIETVLQRLGMANFDPEFSPQYEQALVSLYNSQTGRDLRLRQRRGLPAVLDFLRR